LENEINYTILMADDDEDDCNLAKESFFECCDQTSVGCVPDGLKLMEYLAGYSQPSSKSLPKLILLDLNMPRMDGRQALVEIKAKPTLKNIPIVIFTTSGEESDIALTMNAGADLFVTKPASFDEWLNIMRSLVERWLN